MSKLKNGRRKNDKGFSLIEVLCAIVLLGLIAAPMIQMIYSSYATNQKSKRYLAASDLCQTIMEGISAQTYEDSTTTSGDSVKGLGAYYFPASDPSSVIGTTKGLYKLPNTDATDLTSDVIQGRVSGVSEKPFTGLSNKTICFNNVEYSEYEFNVLIRAKEQYVYPADMSKKYFSIQMEVVIYDTKYDVDEDSIKYDENHENGDYGSFKESSLSDYKAIQQASTCIPNKR